jgi:hypothetical protein
MKKRWIGFSVAVGILALIWFLDLTLGLLLSKRDKTAIMQYYECRENFCNNFNYPTTYTEDSKSVKCEILCAENPEALRSLCGVIPRSELEKIDDIVHVIWAFVFDSSFMPFYGIFVAPPLILFVGYRIGYFFEKKSDPILTDSRGNERV